MFLFTDHQILKYYRGIVWGSELHDLLDFGGDAKHALFPLGQRGVELFTRNMIFFSMVYVF